jgi:hypothetical protein
MRLTAVFLLSLPALSLAVVQCADKEFTCPDRQTCCKLTGDGFGCCPMPNAVCCNDNVHCCAHGTTCDTEKGTCNSAFADIFDAFLISNEWQLKNQADKVSLSPSNEIPTDDGANDKCQCPEDVSTCCKMGAGGQEWGCCPMVGAVCCPDHATCCPHGTVCDASSGRCNSKFSYIFQSLLGSTHVGQTKLEPAQMEEEEKEEVPAWYYDADYEHDDYEGFFYEHKEDEQQMTPNVVRVEGAPEDFGSNRCDAFFGCNPGFTCCKDEWAVNCCAMENAVCCPFQNHCCPGGSVCHPTEAMRCINETMHEFPSTRTVDAMPLTEVFEVEVTSDVNDADDDQV